MVLLSTLKYHPFGEAKLIRTTGNLVLETSFKYSPRLKTTLGDRGLFHSCIQLMYIESTICTKLCVWCWEYSDKMDIVSTQNLIENAEKSTG